MTQTSSAMPATVRLRVELFGTARLVSGRRQTEICVPEHATASDLAWALGEACPELVGSVVRDDRSSLLESYTFNLNGARFLSGGPIHLDPGDTVLVFSSQAGG